MFELVTRYWWVLVLRGVLAILVGVTAFLWPGLTIEVLIAFFGAYMLVDGLFAILNAIAGRRQDGEWWLVLLGGIAGVLVGVWTFQAPGVAAAALVIYLAAWAIVKGVLEVMAAIRLRKAIEGEIWLALAGIASIAFGVLLLAFPLLGALSLLWVIACYTIAFGTVLVVLGFRARGARGLLAAA